MKILIVTLYYIPDDGPDPPLMSALVEELIKLGHDVSVVCSFPHYKKKNLPPTYRNKFHEIEKINSSYCIYRTWVFVPKKLTLLSRFLNYLSFTVLGLFISLLVVSPDVTIVYSPPPSNGLIGLFISKVYGSKMVYNVQDIYPDIMIKLGMINDKKIIALFQRFEHFLYNRSSAITVISTGFKQNLIEKGVDEKKIYIVPNWVDTDFIKPLYSNNGFRENLNWIGKFVVLYSGNIGESQGLDILIEVANELTSHNNILFAIVGEGERKLELERKANTAKLKNMIFYSYFAKEEYPLLLASAEFH
jgi:colanic acid biosynthesis glycosyl transferase WcaI